MAARKKKKDNKRKQKKRSQKAKLWRRRLPEGATVVVTPPGAEKMSEVLEEFVEPYMELCSTEDAVRKLLTLALVAWNAALVSGSQREDLLQKTLATVPADVRPELRATVEEMIQRKESLFASNKRMILDFQLTSTPTGPHLSVISTFPSP